MANSLFLFIRTDDEAVIQAVIMMQGEEEEIKKNDEFVQSHKEKSQSLLKYVEGYTKETVEKLGEIFKVLREKSGITVTFQMNCHNTTIQNPGSITVTNQKGNKPKLEVVVHTRTSGKEIIDDNVWNFWRILRWTAIGVCIGVVGFYAFWAIAPVWVATAAAATFGAVGTAVLASAAANGTIVVSAATLAAAGLLFYEFKS